jgi:UDP-2,3-diacylglucosamine pyrophosphatase LpxH
MLTVLTLSSIIDTVEINYDSVKTLREQGLSWREIGEHFSRITGQNSETCKERARGYWRRGNSKIKRKNNETSNKFEYKIGPLVDKTQEALLLEHGYDPEHWEIVDSSHIKRGENVQSRVKVKPKVNLDIKKEEITTLLKQLVGKHKKEYPPKESGDSIVVIPLYDLHLGRRSGERNHLDTEKTVMRVIEDVANHLSKSPPDAIILPIGQDFLNADTVSGTTTKGTPQDNSLRWHEMLTRGISLAMAIIEKLAEVAPVEVYYSMGNHDEVLSYAVVQALFYRYEDASRIYVEPQMRHRVYITHGKNLIGLSHGNEEKNLHNIMQIEQREEWGKRTHNYWLVGHLHHLSMKEEDGVTVIRCPSLTFDDEWTIRKGYVGSRKGLMVVEFHKDDGLKEMYFATSK